MIQDTSVYSSLYLHPVTFTQEAAGVVLGCLHRLIGQGDALGVDILDTVLIKHLGACEPEVAIVIDVVKCGVNNEGVSVFEVLDLFLCEHNYSSTVESLSTSFFSPSEPIGSSL